jgi:hypothetical protein
MLEVLKHLQVKPPTGDRQGNFCNQNMSGDCVSLKDLHLGNLSYRQKGNMLIALTSSAASMLQHFLQKRCNALKYLGFTGKTYSLLKNW